LNNHSTNKDANPAITRNVVRQPIASPSKRPSGTPRTMASGVQ
jgi:hypothetical protein